MLDNLLQVNRSAPTVSLKWVFIPFVIVVLMLMWQQRFFTFWVLIPFIIFVAVGNNYLVSRQRNKKLQQLDALKIPVICLQRFKQQYPQLGLKQQRLIEKGFKDYLALHVLTKQAYAMPSKAVDALWHVMLEFPDQYEQFCQQAIGRSLTHQPYSETDTASQNRQRQQLMATWRTSCQLQKLNPRNTHELPRLFAIDLALVWQDGHLHDVNNLSQLYARSLQDTSSSSSSCGSSSSSSNDDSGSGCGSGCGGGD
jgi:uncharacterized membrane protein YgcG